MDADGESIGVGALLVDPTGARLGLLARNVKLNRAGVPAGHSLTMTPATVVDLTLTHERPFAWGNITVSTGYSDLTLAGPTGLDDGVRGYLAWRQALQLSRGWPRADAP